MRPFRSVTGVVAPLDRSDVDTDQIVPKEFLKRVERTGFGRFLFHDWRYAPDGSPRPDFVLNVPAYQGASILVAGRNFGCGSSREHAAWALLDYGFRAVVAPGFADIFHNNCFKNGILPVTLDEADVRRILRSAEARPGYRLTVDLEARRVGDEEGWSVGFAIDPFRRRCLLEGLDDIALSLRRADAIADYESRRPSWLPVLR